MTTSTDRRLGINSSAAIKVSCRVATTANITLSGLQTIDGVTVVADDRVLVKNQTDGADNGIWVAGTSTWQRAKDWDGSLDVKTGTLTFVYSGSTGQGWWYVTTTGTIVVGTTSVSISQTSTPLAVISAFMQTVIDDTSADAALVTLGAAKHGFANVVVNGNFNLARNAGPIALTTTPAVQTVDEWYVFQNTLADGISAQVASGLANIPSCLKIGRTAANTSTNAIIAQSSLRSADSIRLSGKTVVFSFYAKAGANFSGANVNVSLFTGTGTDQATGSMSVWTGAATPISTTQVITSAWVRYQFSATLSSSATQIGYRIYYSPSGTAGADDNLFVTGFDLREGSVASLIEHRPLAYEALLSRPGARACGRLSNLIDAAGPLGASDPFIKCHFIPYNGNLIFVDGRDEIIPDGALAASGGIIGDYRSCYVDKVAGQTLANNTFYFIYVCKIDGVLVLNFSTTGYVQNGAAYGHAVKSDDPTSTLVGICQIRYVSGVPTTYGGARGQNISSYFNQFRASLLTAVSATTIASTTPTAFPDGATLPNGQPTNNWLEWVQWYDQTPRVRAFVNVGANVAGNRVAFGLGLGSSSAITGMTAQTRAGSTGQISANISVQSEPTDNTAYKFVRAIGYQIFDASTASTASYYDGYLFADGVMV